MHVEIFVLGQYLLDDFYGTVRGTVIHEDILDIFESLAKKRTRTSGYVWFHLVDRNDYTDSWHGTQRYAKLACFPMFRNKLLIMHSREGYKGRPPFVVFGYSVVPDATCKRWENSKFWQALPKLVFPLDMTYFCEKANGYD